jgi:Zn-dependent M28 family amino/carboxypeptidase
LKKTNPELLKAHKIDIDSDMIASPNYVRGVWAGDNIKDDKLRNETERVHNLIKNYFESRGLPIFKFQFNGRSDFQPFLDSGIPAGGVITGEDEIKSPESAELFGGISGMVLDPCYHQDCDRLESLRGPGTVILEQNMAALGYVLEKLAANPDIDAFLSGQQ